jgi:uncharacterized protein YkwD
MTITRRLVLLLVALVAAALATAPAASAAAPVTQERAVIRLVNAIRAEHGLPALRAAAPLTRAARGHSTDMGRGGYFSHVTRSTGATFAERVRSQRPGQVRWLGEVIGWGVGAPGTPAGLVEAWMNSAPHRATLLDRRFRRIGVGAWQGTFEGYAGATVFTANLAG